MSNQTKNLHLPKDKKQVNFLTSKFQNQINRLRDRFARDPNAKEGWRQKQITDEIDKVIASAKSQLPNIKLDTLLPKITSGIIRLGQSSITVIRAGLVIAHAGRVTPPLVNDDEEEHPYNIHDSMDYLEVHKTAAQQHVFSAPRHEVDRHSALDRLCLYIENSSNASLLDKLLHDLYFKEWKYNDLSWKEQPPLESVNGTVPADVPPPKGRRSWIGNSKDRKDRLGEGKKDKHEDKEDKNGLADTAIKHDPIPTDDGRLIGQASSVRSINDMTKNFQKALYYVKTNNIILGEIYDPINVKVAAMLLSGCSPLVDNDEHQTHFFPRAVVGIAHSNPDKVKAAYCGSIDKMGPHGTIKETDNVDYSPWNNVSLSKLITLTSPLQDSTIPIARNTATVAGTYGLCRVMMSLVVSSTALLDFYVYVYLVITDSINPLTIPPNIMQGLRFFGNNTPPTYQYWYGPILREIVTNQIAEVATIDIPIDEQIYIPPSGYIHLGLYSPVPALTAASVTIRLAKGLRRLTFVTAASPLKVKINGRVVEAEEVDIRHRLRVASMTGYIKQGRFWFHVEEGRIENGDEFTSHPRLAGGSEDPTVASAEVGKATAVGAADVSVATTPAVAPPSTVNNEVKTILDEMKKTMAGEHDGLAGTSHISISQYLKTWTSSIIRRHTVMTQNTGSIITNSLIEDPFATTYLLVATPPDAGETYLLFGILPVPKEDFEVYIAAFPFPASGPDPTAVHKNIASWAFRQVSSMLGTSTQVDNEALNEIRDEGMNYVDDEAGITAQLVMDYIAIECTRVTKYNKDLAEAASEAYYTSRYSSRLPLKSFLAKYGRLRTDRVKWEKFLRRFMDIQSNFRFTTWDSINPDSPPSAIAEQFATMKAAISSPASSGILNFSQQVRVQTIAYNGDVMSRILIGDGKKYAAGAIGSFSQILISAYLYQLQCLPLPTMSYESIVANYHIRMADADPVSATAEMYGKPRFPFDPRTAQDQTVSAFVTNMNQITAFRLGYTIDVARPPDGWGENLWGTSVAVVPITNGMTNAPDLVAAWTLLFLSYPYKVWAYNATAVSDSGTEYDNAETLLPTAAAHAVNNRLPYSKVLYVLVNSFNSGQTLTSLYVGSPNVATEISLDTNGFAGVPVDITPALNNQFNGFGATRTTFLNSMERAVDTWFQHYGNQEDFATAMAMVAGMTSFIAPSSYIVENLDGTRGVHGFSGADPPDVPTYSAYTHYPALVADNALQIHSSTSNPDMLWIVPGDDLDAQIDWMSHHMAPRLVPAVDPLACVDMLYGALVMKNKPSNIPKSPISLATRVRVLGSRITELHDFIMKSSGIPMNYITRLGDPFVRQALSYSMMTGRISMMYNKFESAMRAPFPLSNYQYKSSALFTDQAWNIWTTSFVPNDNFLTDNRLACYSRIPYNRDFSALKVDTPKSFVGRQLTDSKYNPKFLNYAGYNNNYELTQFMPLGALTDDAKQLFFILARVYEQQEAPQTALPYQGIMLTTSTGSHTFRVAIQAYTPSMSQGPICSLGNFSPIPLSTVISRDVPMLPAFPFKWPWQDRRLYLMFAPTGEWYTNITRTNYTNYRIRVVHPSQETQVTQQLGDGEGSSKADDAADDILGF